MTKEEWINEDNGFYHLTQTSNIPSILQSGLKKGVDNPFGICVIRNIDPLVIEYLCQTMLRTTDELNFSIIEIKPLSHNLQVQEIGNDDHIVEVTKPLHNYIKRKCLKIEPENIKGEYSINPQGIADLSKYEEELLRSGLIEILE